MRCKAIGPKQGLKCTHFGGTFWYDIEKVQLNT